MASDRLRRLSFAPMYIAYSTSRFSGVNERAKDQDDNPIAMAERTHMTIKPIFLLEHTSISRLLFGLKRN